MEIDLLFLLELIAFGFIIFLAVSYARIIFKISPTNKVVLISGCDSGFGNGTAIELAKLGFKVIAGCYTPAGVESFKGMNSIIPIQLDITSENSIKDAFEVVKKHTPNGLWALINNAGIVDGLNIDFTTLKVYRSVMEVNFFGHVAMTKQFLPLIKKGKGRIINMASVAGRVASAKMSAYTTSKHAMEGWSEGLRQDLWEFGIRVIILEPAFMKTTLVTQDIERTIVNTLKNAPKELLAEYGENFQADLLNKAVPRATSLSDDPAVVVAAYVNAVISKFPKTRYMLGKGSWLFVSFSFLPSWLFDPLMVLLFK